MCRYRRAGGGDAQAAAFTFEQAHTQGGFKLFEHIGGRRLSHAELGSGRAQSAQGTHFEQQRHLAQAHAVEQMLARERRCH